MVNIIVITPEEYKSKSSEFKIIYGRHSSPFGDCLIGITGPEKAVCFLSFVDNNYDKCLDMLKKEWLQADFVEDPTDTAEIVKKIFSTNEQENLSVILRGTDFQVKVWKALLDIPRGEAVTYSEIAEKIGSKGVRAAGTAMKANRVAYLVPCHRVTNKAGDNKYRWGAERRTQIMEYERQRSR